MQRISLLFLVLTTLSAGAQSAMIVDRPVLTPSPVTVQGGPVLGSDLNPPATNNLARTSVTVADLAALLGNLQGAVQQALPVVAAFNDSFVFTNAPAAPGANFAVNLGSNFATNMASNLGVNLANPAAATGVTTAPGSADATVRALVVLQNEMQEILPVLNALNGGTNAAALGAAPALAPGSVTNVFR